jgi:hypothetical protein
VSEKVPVAEPDVQIEAVESSATVGVKSDAVPYYVPERTGLNAGIAVLIVLLLLALTCAVVYGCLRRQGMTVHREGWKFTLRTRDTVGPPTPQKYNKAGKKGEIALNLTDISIAEEHDNG